MSAATRSLGYQSLRTRLQVRHVLVLCTLVAVVLAQLTVAWLQLGPLAAPLALGSLAFASSLLSSDLFDAPRPLRLAGTVCMLSTWVVAAALLALRALAL
jgi:hypothetical protein